MANNQYEEAIQTFTKLENYKDSAEKVKESNYKYYEYLIKEKKFHEAADLIPNLKNYKDENFLWYTIAKQQYTEGDFDGSLKSFSQIPDYKDSNTYQKKIKLLKEMQGEWIGVELQDDETGKIYSNPSYGMIIENYMVRLEYPYNIEPHIRYLDYYDGKIVVGIDDRMVYELTERGYLKVITKFKNGSMKFEFFKRGSIQQISKKIQQRNPLVGMTADEVRKSTWGNPKDINRTTTSYGVDEQWVYYGNRYVYLKNGIVTAIQD